jgi:hypothetical protein
VTTFWSLVASYDVWSRNWWFSLGGHFFVFPSTTLTTYYYVSRALLEWTLNCRLQHYGSDLSSWEARVRFPDQEQEHREEVRNYGVVTPWPTWTKTCTLIIYPTWRFYKHVSSRGNKNVPPQGKNVPGRTRGGKNKKCKQFLVCTGATGPGITVASSRDETWL